MATIICNGCFDLFHKGHCAFLMAAREIPYYTILSNPLGQNRLIVCVNSDQSAKRLKVTRWGTKYPINSWEKRMDDVKRFADEVRGFDSESDLREIIKHYMPCIIVKGPDYAGKRVTGDDLAPVLILDTPEPESVKAMKRGVYFSSW